MNFNDFDDTLRGALRREPAPPDFAGTVLARARRSGLPVWKRPVALALAAGLLLAVLIPPAISAHQRRERERAVEAEAQLVTALTITRSQLRRVSARIQRNTRRPL